MDADWDTKRIFIEATTIVVDQSKSFHCENAGSNEHGADGEEKRERKRMVTKLEMRMWHSCDSSVSPFKDLCNTLHLPDS